MKQPCKHTITLSLLIFLLLSPLTLLAQVYDDDILFEELRLYEQREFENMISTFQGGEADPRQPLSLGRDDILFVSYENEKYIDLFIRKKDHVQSVLLTTVRETIGENQYGDLEYGLRALNYNEVNGNEYRIFKGKRLGSQEGLYFLVDSTPVHHATMGWVFHIRIPEYVMYGYPPQGDFGYIRIIPGETRLNIRTFERPYADYRGAFYDNHVIVDLARYDGSDINPPTITQFQIEPVNNEYVAVYLRYQDNNMFFNGFYIKEVEPYTPTDELAIRPNMFRRIHFTADDAPSDEKAVLLRSYYSQEGGKIIEIKLFLKRMPTERRLEINAQDQFENMALESVIVRVPPITEMGTVPNTRRETQPWILEDEEF